MKEFIEKLISRLNVKMLDAQKNAVKEMSTNGHTLDYEYEYGSQEAHEDVIENANQLAEEYNGGWIPCSERLPDKRDWYLAVFQEADTGFISLPFIADYLMGVHTKYTTEDGWIIANCTDIEEGRAEYYKKLKCVAWQP